MTKKKECKNCTFWHENDKTDTACSEIDPYDCTCDDYEEVTKDLAREYAKLQNTNKALTERMQLKNEEIDLLITAIIKTYEQELIAANEELDLNKEIAKEYQKRIQELEDTCLEFNDTCQYLRRRNEQQAVEFTSLYLKASQNPS